MGCNSQKGYKGGNQRNLIIMPFLQLLSGCDSYFLSGFTPEETLLIAKLTAMKILIFFSDKDSCMWYISLPARHDSIEG